jgi:gas vesicle protein
MNTEEKFFWGALIGSAIGAAAALLFTPLAGRHLRKRILNGLYEPLSLPKSKILGTKPRRPVPKTRLNSRLDGRAKAAKKGTHKTGKND